MDSPAAPLLVAVVVTAEGQAEAVVVAGENEPLRFPLRAADPKKPIRFAVGRPGKRSSVWRLWANKARDDVYVAVRRSAGIFKVSLHESGDWRIQWVGQDRQDVLWTTLDGDDTDGRVLDQWMRTVTGASRWTDALSIWIPHDDVAAVPGDAEPGEGTQWLDPPGPGRAVELRIVLAPPSPVLVDMSAAVSGPESTFALVDGFRLAGGDAVLLFAASGPLEAARLADLGRFRTECRDQAAAGWDLSPETGPRAAAITADNDGYRSIWDLSLA